MIIFLGSLKKKRRKPDTFYPLNLINFIKVINFYPVFILSAKNNWIPNRQHSVRNKVCKDRRYWNFKIDKIKVWYPMIFLNYGIGNLISQIWNGFSDYRADITKPLWVFQEERQPHLFVLPARYHGQGEIPFLKSTIGTPLLLNEFIAARIHLLSSPVFHILLTWETVFAILASDSSCRI